MILLASYPPDGHHCMLCATTVRLTVSRVLVKRQKHVEQQNMQVAFGKKKNEISTSIKKLKFNSQVINPFIISKIINYNQQNTKSAQTSIS